MNCIVQIEHFSLRYMDLDREVFLWLFFYNAINSYQTSITASVKKWLFQTHVRLLCLFPYLDIDFTEFSRKVNNFRTQTLAISTSKVCAFVEICLVYNVSNNKKKKKRKKKASFFFCPQNIKPFILQVESQGYIDDIKWASNFLFG